LIAVADNGAGIPRKEQRRIFTSFFRSPLQSSVKGHGIGLSSVEQIVKAHGGNIKLESEQGKGSIFTISLPDKQ
jgi:Osmosensitive K+ channel histidine kinase